MVDVHQVPGKVEAVGKNAKEMLGPDSGQHRGDSAR